MQDKKDTAYNQFKNINSGECNVMFGSELLKTPYVVDTSVYCKKCKCEHKIDIAVYSKKVTYRAKCGGVFSLTANEQKISLNYD